MSGGGGGDVPWPASRYPSRSMVTAAKRIALLTACVLAAACRNDPANLTELERARAGPLEVVLLSSREAIRHGTDDFVIEFRSSPGGALVDVGAVKGSASMPMAGTPMLGSIDIARTSVPGRYQARSDLGMAGTWRMTIEWRGSPEAGSVTLSRSVQ